VIHTGKLHGDVATGVFFSVSFALGVLLLGLRDPTRPVVSIESILFGSILAIGPTDLAVVVATSVVVAIFLGVFWGRLAYATFDPKLARLSGVPVARLDYVLLALTAVVIVVSVQTVGVVLVSSFVVLPAATATLVARSLGRATAIAVGLGTGGAAFGLLASYHLDVPSGATIILGLGVVFFVTLIAKR
jgi:zinc transport system permease protein